MTLSLARPRSADAFLDVAGGFLVAREAELKLIFGIRR
jgi:hypothetical protein